MRLQLIRTAAAASVCPFTHADVLWSSIYIQFQFILSSMMFILRQWSNESSWKWLQWRFFWRFFLWGFSHAKDIFWHNELTLKISIRHALLITSTNIIILVWKLGNGGIVRDLRLCFNWTRLWWVALLFPHGVYLISSYLFNNNVESVIVINIFVWFISMYL